MLLRRETHVIFIFDGKSPRVAPSVDSQADFSAETRWARRTVSGFMPCLEGSLTAQIGLPRVSLCWNRRGVVRKRTDAEDTRDGDF